MGHVIERKSRDCFAQKLEGSTYNSSTTSPPSVTDSKPFDVNLKQFFKAIETMYVQRDKNRADSLQHLKDMFREKEADREDANNEFVDNVNLIRDGQMTLTQSALATSDSTLMEIMNIDKYS